MFEALLKVNGEVWDCYCVVDDQWPAEGVLETYKVRTAVHIFRKRPACMGDITRFASCMHAYAGHCGDGERERLLC